MEAHNPQAASGAVMLFFTALIWGFAFVAQSVAMDHMGPYTFGAARFLLAGLSLMVFLLLRSRLVPHPAGRTEEEAREARRAGLMGGLVCGISLFVAATLQQAGLQYTTPGKAGFLTALYIILVPIYSIPLGKRPGMRVWIAALIALLGLYLLCVEGEFGLSRGDLLCVLCSLTFPFQILLLDHYVMRTDAVFLTCVQFLTVAGISMVFSLLFDHPSPADFQGTFFMIFYAGFCSGAVAYTLQGVGQKRLRNPSAASLFMSLESVFAALAGWLLLHQGMSGRKLLGCGLMFAAILLAQLPGKEAS